MKEKKLGYGVRGLKESVLIIRFLHHYLWPWAAPSWFIGNKFLTFCLRFESWEGINTNNTVWVGGLWRQTWNVKTSKSLRRHVKLDEGRQNRVVLDVKILGGRHGDQCLDPCQGDKTSNIFLISWSSTVHRLNLLSRVKYPDLEMGQEKLLTNYWLG